MFQKSQIIKGSLNEEENAADAGEWSFMVVRGDIGVEKDIFITFDDNLKKSNNDFNILVRNYGSRIEKGYDSRKNNLT